MSNLLIPPHVPFSDIDGTPLSDGFINIGEKDKDPIQFPISAYWDEAKTKPITQPIRTKNGYIVNNGIFSKIYIDQQNCSVLVKNRFQTTIYLDNNSILFSNFAAVNQVVQVEQNRAMAAEASINIAVSNETNRAISAEGLLQNQINANGIGNRAYKTYSDMSSDVSNIPEKSKLTVTNDPDNTKNGDYQFDGSVFTKSIYDPLTQMKNLVGSSTPNVFINTKIILNFIENTLTGGGGIVSYGTLFVDNIPENQSLALEFSEGFPFGLRKICIHKTTGLFRVFNSSEFVSENYVLLGYLFEKRWYSIASGKKPTIVANALDDYEGNITELEYENDAEIVAGSLSINKTSKTIIGTCTVYAPKYRAYTEVNVTFTGELTAIVFDTNSKSVKALVDTDVLAPSYLVLAKVEGNNIFTTSVNSAFAQVGDDKYSVYGKVDQKVLSSEPTFMSTELKLKIDFSLGQIGVEQNGFIFCNATFQAIDSEKNIEFSATNPTYVRYLAYNTQSQKFTLLQNRQVNLGNQEVLLGYVYDYKFYGFGDFKSKVTIINSSGNVVDNSDQDSFDELKQRALIPNKLFFINDRSLPLYKDSIFSNPKVGLEKVRTWIDTNNTDTLKRYVPVQQQTILNPSDLSNTAQFVYAHASVANKRYWKNVAVSKAAQSKLSRSFNMLCFGDSLTQVGTPWTLKNKLESLGATVTPVGTFWSTETPNELPSEGRGYWNYREFIGKDNNSSGTPHTRSEGGKTRTTKFETPFLKLATTQDKTDHPTWCFRFTGAQKELSYADDPNKAGNFYIFDFDWYLTQHSVANPDFITIGLSTNDINLDRDVYSRAEVMQFMQLGLEIMVKQIHKVLPNVPIGIIPCPAWSATENGYATFAADTANWVELCIKKVAELKATHSNLEVIPVHLHMNRDMGYPLTAGSALTVDSNVNVSVVSDWVHYDQIGRDQYAEVVAAWLANSI